MKKHIVFILLTTLALSLQAQENHTYEVGKNIDLFNRVYKTLDEYYVDTLHAEKLIPDAIQYMLEGLDPYTEYLSAEEAQSLQTLNTGKYAGIGAVIRYDKETDRCMIYEPYEGMPAALAGVRAGDIILSIAGKEIPKKGDTPTDKYTSSVSNQLRGDAGTSFILKVKRPGVADSMNMEIHRATISLPAVPYFGMVTDSIGFIKLTTFSRGCADAVLKALKELKNEGAKSLILDLRDNGGGLAIEAVDLVNLFVPKGKLVLSMKGKYKTSNVKYFTHNQPEDLNIPLVVLVNGQSASSSEITCGSLQDFDRAVIMGERTYGKGLVQQPHELPYGGILKLTTSHYYIPSGRCIQALDYSRKNASGEAYRTPDSLTHVFKTSDGREVRDGGGITPDIKAVSDSLPNLIYYLQASDQLQHFCTDYCNKHQNIAPAKDFCISDEDFEDFKNYIKKSDFTYDRQSFKVLQELKKIAKREGYDESAKTEFDALEKKLTHDIDYDFNLWKKEITESLNAEICLRYYYRKGYYASTLQHDKVLNEAIRLLRNPKLYKSILKK